MKKVTLPVEYPSTMMFNHHKYDLFATTNHFGSMEGGHYTAIVKHKDELYNVDDHVVTKLSENAWDTKSRNTIYMLFYRFRN